MFLEIFKVATPYILAFIVYLVWHVQKEKEVISSEARNLLNLLNNFENEIRRFRKLIDKSYRKLSIEGIADIGLLEDELSKINVLHYEIISSIDFISSSV